jgi:sulfur-carrier protein adenylyltransferase/sulfurtransferase
LDDALDSFGPEQHADATHMNISPAELKARLDRGDKFRLIDVREPDEWAIARLPTAELMPLSQFQKHAEELDAGEDIVVYCHHGMRSGRVQDFLKAKGFTNVKNLTGGIDAWATQVDPATKRY